MITWLPTDDNLAPFPDVEAALTDPDGLLAAGGNLSVERLLLAYRQGIFPWYSEDEPILWWSPTMRAVIFPDDIHISRSLNKVIRKDVFNVTHNQAFNEIIAGCAAPRRHTNETWITDEMMNAYIRMHELGYARSVECWQGDRLVGGIYGMQLGKVFYGESMFSQVPNASKIAMVEIARQPEIALIDCQLPNEHLRSMGMVTIPRRQFMSLLDQWCVVEPLKSVAY